MNDVARPDDGFRGSEERGTTVEKVPHPRLIVQSGPGVLFAYLSTSTVGTTTTTTTAITTTATSSAPPPSHVPHSLRRVFFPSEVVRGWLSELFLPSLRTVSPRPRRHRRGGKGVVEGAIHARVCAVRYFSADDGAELGINFKIICLGFSRLSNRLEFRGYHGQLFNTLSLFQLFFFQFFVFRFITVNGCKKY